MLSFFISNLDEEGGKTTEKPFVEFTLNKLSFPTIS